MSIAKNFHFVDIPLPETPRHFVKGVTGYPFDRLEVGKAFECPGRARSTVRQAITRYYRHNGREKRFVERVVGGCVVVFRLK